MDLLTPSKDYPASWSYTPADEALDKAYADAVAMRKEAPKELVKRYGSLYGALMHSVKYRPEISVALACPSRRRSSTAALCGCWCTWLAPRAWV